MSDSDESAAAEPLACPTCTRKYPLTERFCADCDMPLVYVGRRDEEPITGAHERARKVKPEYTRGELVKAAFAHNLAEAELIQGILLEEGIPSVERRSRGFDVPDFLAAGPRDILVPREAYAPARELLAGTGEQPEREPGATATAPAPLQLLVGLLVAVAIAALIAWIVSTVI